MVKILYLDNDADSVQYLQSLLPEGFEVHGAYRPEELLGRLAGIGFDLVVLALEVIRNCREAVIDFLRETWGYVPLVLVTEGAPESNYRAILASGAREVVSKPFTRSGVQNMLNLLEPEPDLVFESIPEDDEKLWGTSVVMAKLRRSLQLAAECSDPVLLLGETGTGKEVCARFIHHCSSRSGKVFKALNCGALPEHLIEAELFGVVQGAYTEARDRPGLIESAQNGTLLLDELADLPLRQQVKLLRFLEDGEIYRLGSSEARYCNARIITATNGNIKDLILRGLFREDLYYRLNAMEIRVPALREHREDIPVYSQRFLDQYRRDNPLLQARRISLDACSWLVSQDWPGNVRQLRNVVRTAAVRAWGQVIERSAFVGELSRI